MSKLKYYDGTNWVDTTGVVTGDTLPIGSIIDYNGTTVPAGWEQINDYSTTEVKTGSTWIDGKPIYRIVYNKDISVSSSWTGITMSTFGLTNYDTIYLSGNSFRLQDSRYIKPLGETNVYIDKTQGAIYFPPMTNATKFTIVIEYTKTTD